MPAKKKAKKSKAKPKAKAKAKKPAAKKAKKAAPKPKVKAKRKPNAAFMKPLRPDDVLAAVIGPAPKPRTEVTKAIWDYIKKNGLQDKTVRTQINADDKLRAVFNGKGSVSMFDMTKLVNSHLIQ
ncbi:MAG TPA: SWIB/MDM2 domain-containing protein [Verrucomicrobiae bacterium]|nr:SWIB/MDM2 domain-containing protein [Verrucomicrobiae bacterium]